MPDNIFTKLFSRNGTKNIDSDLGRSLERQGITGDSLFGRFKNNDYENAYPSISKLANAFTMIEPYTVDINGKPVGSNILDRFYTPNVQMSAADWREALAVMTIVHSKVYIRVHHRTTRALASTITGFTILEGVYEFTEKGKTVYQLTTGEHLGAENVIVLKGINPYGLSRGFSPIEAARKWINIDDYIAAYQSGFFANGAVPAGQFIISARTHTEFNDIVAGLKAKHRGADKNNNVVYTYNQFDPSTGKGDGGAIQWIPFNTTNKDLALKDIFAQANKKIDSAFGVPASIRGVNDQNTYASVRIDEVIFAKYAVDPMAMKLYSKFTHELNRITGGTGVAFAYNLEIPQVADEEKVKAEAKAIELKIITDAILAGYSLESIVSSFDLPESYNNLRTTGVVTIEDDKPEVLTTEEMAETPDQPLEAIGELVVHANKSHKETKNLDDEELRAEYEGKVEAIAKAQLQKQVDGADAEITKSIEATEDDITTFATNVFAAVSGLILIEGAKQRTQGLALLVEAGLQTTPGEFLMTQAQTDAYRTYLLRVGESYTSTNATLIRAVLDNASERGLSVSQTKAELTDLVSRDFQAQRLARTEVSRAASQASVDAMENIQSETGFSVVKVWNVNADACEFCLELEGKEEPVDGVFLKEGSDITGASGAKFENNFVDVQDATLHPNCSCFTTYEVRG